MSFSTQEYDIVILGGGAAGFFGALACAEKCPSAQIVILEKTRQPLAKVRVSGGGRCNTTHSCFIPAELKRRYPRGSLFLQALFHRFQPRDTIEWFETRGVDLKVEKDGRMFPITDSSQTIIDCFQNEAKKKGIEIRLGMDVISIQKNDSIFMLECENKEKILAKNLLVATGSNPKSHVLIKTLGHTIIPPVPSLFTFHIEDPRLSGLAGVTIPEVTVQCLTFKETGPLLITHWGLSGPAILRLSAWAARELHAVNYSAELKIQWVAGFNQEEMRLHLLKIKKETPSKRIMAEPLFNLPRQLWERLLHYAGIGHEVRYSGLSRLALLKLCETLVASKMLVKGKSIHKEEFVSCGGVNLDEVNPRTMQSLLCPGLYFAGEVLDIDGITGGFNFQNAWTTSWIAAQSMNL